MSTPLPTRIRRRVAALVAAALVLSASLFLGAPAADAAVLDVGPTEADLRAAFVTADANGQADELVLTPGATYDLTCAAGGQLTHTALDDLVITGNGATIRQTCPGERVLDQQGTGLVAVTDVTITGGNTMGDGGGIQAEGPVSVLRSSFLDNENGAIDAAGGIALVESTVSGNSHSDGIVVTSGHGVLRVVNSTVTDNSSANNSILYGDDGVVLVFATVVGNAGSENVRSVDTGGTETPSLDAFASVVTGTTDGGAACDVDGSMTTYGYNWSTDGTCDFFEPTDTADGTDPMVGALAANGGPTPTMLPAATSPLLDRIPEADCQAALAAGIDADQRGVSRPQGGACDIGAVEVEVSNDVPSDGDGPGASAGGASPAAPVALQPRFTG